MEKWIIEAKQDQNSEWEFIASHERAFTSGFSHAIGQGEACEIAAEHADAMRPIAVRVSLETAGPDEHIYSHDGQTWIDAKRFKI